MRQLDAIYPQYGLAAHKGYAVPEHRKALRQHGPTPLHRRSFAPVRASDPQSLDDSEIIFDDGELAEWAEVADMAEGTEAWA